MSIECNLNMDIRLKDIPDNMRLWFKAMEGVTCDEDYRHVGLTVPPIIEHTAGRMEHLNKNHHDDDSFYKYEELGDYSRLRLSITHKNKDDDTERFIHFILPYIIDYLTGDSIMLTTCDSEQETWMIDVDSTIKMSDVTDVEKVHLISELQMYTNNIDYETVEFMDNVKKYLKDFNGSLDYV